MRNALIVLLSILLVGQASFAQEPANNSAVKQSIAGLPANAHIALHLMAGDTIRGHIDGAGDANLVLRPDDGSGRQTFAYTQISSVERIKGHSARKWIIAGVAAAVVAVGITALVVLENRKY